MKAIEVSAPMKASGSELRVRIEMPTTATRPPPKRSVIRAIQGATSSIPRPCGPTRRPVTMTLSPRTCW